MNKKKGVTSNLDGVSSIMLDKVGVYNLEFSFVGYQTYKTVLKVNSGQDKKLEDIVLKEDVEQLQSVEIVGIKRKYYNSVYSFSSTKMAIKNKELPQSVGTVTKELIVDKQAFQL